jgi:hypothetical protein
MAREIATICRIADILSGTYIVQEGWQPNYVETPLGKISRVNIIGTVVDIESAQSFTLDDATGKVTVRSFDKPHNISLGTTIMLIARPRAYNNEHFLMPEIIKPITNPAWISYRKEELSHLHPLKKQAVATIVDIPPPADPAAALLDKIREHDNGPGAAIEDIITTPEEDVRLQKFLEEGIVFHNKPGFVKLL